MTNAEMRGFDCSDKVQRSYSAFEESRVSCTGLPRMAWKNVAGVMLPSVVVDE